MENKKIKIAYVVHGLGAEGISSFTCNLMSKLDMAKYDVTVIMAVDQGGEPQEKEEQVLSYGVNILRTCDLYNVKYIKKHLTLLKNYLIEYGPFDAIHSNMDLLNGLNLKVAKKVGIKTRISHSHKALSIDYSNSVKNMAAKAYRALMKKEILKNATDLIGCSDKANEYMYGDAPSTVIINGIDIKKFSDVTINIAKYKKELGLINDTKIILTVARLHEQKNPFFIVKIIEELLKIRNDFVFLWVGDGHLKNAVESEICNKDLNDYFKLIGTRNDIPQILHCSDVFLLPSLFEGLPISAIEAQCAGCDCVIADNVTRLVDGGKCTFLSIGASDAQQWAEEISCLLDKKERTVLSEEALHSFDVQAMADKVAMFYDKSVKD